MSLVDLAGNPLTRLGVHLPAGATTNAFASTAVTVDAANESVCFYGRLFTDDAQSHTIDTSGSSAIGLRIGTVTFSNGGSIFKVGVADVLATAGPPARAVHSTDVITMDASRSMTGGGGGVTANSWNSFVPTAGSKTIAHGDLVAICAQLTARGGADSIQVQTNTLVTGQNWPGVTSYLSGAYAAVTAAPNCAITFSDGHVGWLAGATVAASISALTLTSASGQPEQGNLLQFPFPVRVQGFYGSFQVNGDSDIVLYSDPLGTPVSQRTQTIDANQMSTTTNPRIMESLFSSPYDVAANTPFAIIAKPGASGLTYNYKTSPSSALQIDHGGANCYAVGRASGAFVAINSGLDRHPLGVLVSAFDAGGGSGVAMRSRVFTGM